MVMNIRVLTPDRVICSTTANEVVLPGLTGQVGVLDGHAALITANCDRCAVSIAETRRIETKRRVCGEPLHFLRLCAGVPLNHL